MILEGLLYSPSHEWVKVDGNNAYIGISDHAQESLGAVVFIELPKVGSTIKKGEAFGAVESVKAASDLYLPVTGKVIEVNTTLEDAPESVNDDPYGSWMVKVELSDDSELADLLSSDKYEASIEE